MNTLLTDPPLLFCDEPTTGLDSYSAGVVVEKLRQFAASGKVVVCTIHQPASGLFDMFNQVLLVARGRVAFYGDRRRQDYPLTRREPSRLSQWSPVVAKDFHFLGLGVRWIHFHSSSGATPGAMIILWLVDNLDGYPSGVRPLLCVVSFCVFASLSFPLFSKRAESQGLGVGVNRLNRFLVVWGRVSVLSVLPGRMIGGSWPPQVLGGLKRVSAALVGSSVCWRVGAWSGSRSHLESGEKCYCLSRVVRSRFPGELTHIGHGESHLFEFCLYVTGSHVGWESLDYHFDRFVPGQCERVEFLFEVLQQVPLDSKEVSGSLKRRQNKIDVLRRMRCGSSIPEACILSNGGIMLIDRSNYMSRKGVSYDITGVGLNCPATFNRAEFYASQLAVVPGKEMESQRKIQWLCDEFDRSRYGQELIKLVTQARNERRSIIPCRKESDDLDLQSLLEKCYTSNPEVFCIFARSRCTNQARGIVVSAPGGLGFNSLLGPVLQISVESRPRELSNRVQRNGPRNQPPSSLMVIHPLKKSSRATPRVLAHIYYTSVDSSMTNWACGNEAKVLFSALLVNVAFPD
uniref:Uncharacterized protein n=1 Tax=Timema shepardi TaxID=629360 RepID=A0A7R9AQ27_TIMSH|nr:unnamed protein product [Timema shepardi]